MAVRNQSSTVSTAAPSVAEIQEQLAAVVYERNHLRDEIARLTNGTVDNPQVGDARQAFGIDQLASEFTHGELVHRVLLLQETLATARATWARQEAEIAGLRAQLASRTPADSDDDYRAKNRTRALARGQRQAS